MALSDRVGLQRFRLSIIHLMGLGISTALGLAAGSAFGWAAPGQAWNMFLAGFLWTLIVAVGTAVVRCMREQVQRGDWWRGIAVGCEMTFPLTTMYMLAVALITLRVPAESFTQANGLPITSKPDLLTIAPVFYTASLVLAILVGPGYALTSPFRR